MRHSSSSRQTLIVRLRLSKPMFGWTGDGQAHRQLTQMLQGDSFN